VLRGYRRFSKILNEETARINHNSAILVVFCVDQIIGEVEILKQMKEFLGFQDDLIYKLQTGNVKMFFAVLQITD